MADSARIAGWEDGNGEWHNVEAGDREPSDYDLAVSDRIVVAVNVVGEPEPVYWTTSHLTEDYDLEEHVQEIEEGGAYGDQFV